MSRQRLTIGTFRGIGHLVSPNGRVIARARFRDWDGKTRLVQATGDTQKSAERALKATLTEPRQRCSLMSNEVSMRRSVPGHLRE